MVTQSNEGVQSLAHFGEDFTAASEKLDRQYVKVLQAETYLDYPMIVSIETFAKCNASCVFCPYPNLPRKGTVLPRDSVLTLIDEISGFSVPPQRLNLSRVNEPFLDPNLMDYLRHAAATLPKTSLILFFNGQAITDRIIDELEEIPTFRSLVISFNDHDPDAYRAAMGIEYRLTINRLEHLHNRSVKRGLRFAVSLSRVGTSDYRDAAFEEFCRSRFPSFGYSVSARFDWIGEETGGVSSLAPDSGCLQWFSLHVLSDGSEAFCCIDGSGHSAAHGDVFGRLLELYNAPSKRRLRERTVSRRKVIGCQTCVHGMPARAYQPVPADGSCRLIRGKSTSI